MHVHAMKKGPFLFLTHDNYTKERMENCFGWYHGVELQVLESDDNKEKSA